MKRSWANLKSVAAAAWLVTCSSLSLAGESGTVRDTVHRAVDEGRFIDVNGVPQWITIRGRDVSNPVLLILHGGPGIGLSGLAPLFEDWERHFTIVQWDQPCTGSTAIKNLGRDPGPLTVERFTQDAIKVAEHVRERLGQRKLVVLGNSWGTVVGLHVAKSRPDLVAAYVGTSQAVSGKEGGRIGYELALAAARSRGDRAAVEALERVGPPPYERFEDFLVRQQYSNPPGLPASAAEEAASARLIKIFMTPPAPDARYVAYRSIPAEFNGEQNFLNTQRTMFKVVDAWDARDLGFKFEVPMFIFQGDMDLNTPTSLAREYFEQLQAPTKMFVTIKDAGHNTIAFAPDLLALLNEHVRPLVVN